VRVHYDEGVANRIGPEPCASNGEASVGECIGQPLSPESDYLGTPFRQRKATRTGAQKRERPDGPAWSETLACADAPCLWEPGELAFGRSV
jgi:hypothetical protein